MPVQLPLSLHLVTLHITEKPNTHSLADKAGLHFPDEFLFQPLCLRASVLHKKHQNVCNFAHSQEEHKASANPFKQIHGVVVPENGSSLRLWKRENAATGGHTKRDMKIPVCEILLGKGCVWSHICKCTKRAIRCKFIYKSFVYLAPSDIYTFPLFGFQEKQGESNSIARNFCLSCIIRKLLLWSLILMHVHNCHHYYNHYLLVLFSILSSLSTLLILSLFCCSFCNSNYDDDNDGENK